jgi:hypothetical protein
MKKVMIADLIKDLGPSIVQRAMERFELNESDAEQFVDDYPNESDWDQVAYAADQLNLDIMDITPDDVENINEAGEPKGLIDSSMGIIKYIYDHQTQAYAILLVIDGKELVYKDLEPNLMNEILSADSFGTFYNDNLRGNKSYEGCGCKANVCEPTDIAIFSSIS